MDNNNNGNTQEQNDNKVVDKNGAKLLFISDIEGCLPVANKIEQNTSLCQLDTYTKVLTGFLGKTDNEVAFLGDYFDKGQGVVDSIIGIAYLHKKYPTRVHIILGNRDINKFRLAYEIDMKKDERRKTYTTTDIFSPMFHTIIDKSELFDKNGIIKIDQRLQLFHYITDYSMGGMNYNTFNKEGSKKDKEKIKSINNDKRINQFLNEGDSFNWLYDIFKQTNLKSTNNVVTTLDEKYFDDILDNDTIKIDVIISSVLPKVKNSLSRDFLNIKEKYKKMFTYSCRYLFKYGNIVKYNETFKTLMSHAGGFNKCLLNNKTFFDTIIKEFPKNGSYYDNIEYFRQKLICEKEQINDKVTNLTELVSLHQDIYNTFIESFFDDNLLIIENKPTAEFFLLQAMGLKPNGAGIRGSDFASFIQSCGGGCGLFVTSTPEDREFFTFLKSNFVEAIAHGHQPHCMAHPLVFKRSCGDSNSLVFIENDTSNGNRPLDGANNISTLPLSYIELSKDGNKYGIGLLTENGDKFDISGEISRKKSDGKLYSSQTNETYDKLLLNGKSLLVSDLFNEDEIEKIITWNNPIDPKTNTFSPILAFAARDIVGGKSKKRRYSKKSKHMKKMKTRKHKNARRTCKHGCKH